MIDSVSSLRNDTSRTEYSRVTGRLDEVQTGVNAVVNDFLPVDAVLLLEIRVETRLNVLHDGLPAADHNMRTRSMRGHIGHTTHRC